MKKLLALVLFVTNTAFAGTYTPTLELDYTNNCTTGGAPTISGNDVAFGSGTQCQAGRVVSTKRYTNISQITATIDLSKVSSNYVNASFYAVENNVSPGTQPKGANYCDAGGNGTAFNCREIDFIETNGNKLTQTTLHLGDGGLGAPQRYEYSFAATADNSCFNYSSMLTSPTATNGLHSMVGIIDMTKPFDMTTTFTYGSTPVMKTVYSQAGQSVTVYDSSVGTGAEGSGTVDMNDLTATMANGYWLIMSFWQGYSPVGPGSGPWWNGTCAWGALCNSTGSYWSISNVTVTANEEL